MKLFYDLHLHSCLSPCGSDDMTPNNLVNMAALLGFQLIAVTDHNACANTEAAVRAGCAAGITVVPGMELCTSEEAHIVCLFPTPAAALAFEREVARRSPPVRNRPEIFGRQLVLDADDALLREEDRYLLAAADLGAAEAAERVRALGGACFPAHIDREGYSLLSSLGAIPPEPGYRAVEISPRGDFPSLLRDHPELQHLLLLQNSDSHDLAQMPDPQAWVDLPENSAACLLDALNGRFAARWSRPG